MAAERKETYLQRILFMELGGLSSTQISHLCSKYGIQAEPMGLPVFAMIKAIDSERKSAKYTKDGKDVDAELKGERRLKERLNNLEKMGLVVSKERAKERIRTTFQAAANMVRYAIKRAAPRVAVCNDPRDCENIMISEFNSGIDELETQAKDITWEDERGGFDDLTRGTLMAEDSVEDSSRGSREEDSVTP